MNPIEMRGSLLARNTIMNFIGQLIPLIIGVITIPFVIRSLGSDSFGTLGLAWAVLGYFSLFDLGLGRATTQFVAEALGKGETERLPHLIWTSLGIHLLLGLMGGLLLAILTPLLVERVLNIPSALIGDTRSTFFILAISVPVILTSTVLRGVLEASQRFDLVNVVKIPSSSLTFLLPVAGILMGFGLPGIVFFLMMTRLGAALAYLILCLKVFPILKKGFSFDPKVIRPLASYGGWLTVSNILSPILAHLEHFLIASLLSVGMLTFYIAPYEMISRGVIFPASIALTIFPAFSYYGTSNRLAPKELFFRSLKYLLFVMTPMVVVFIVFADEILGLWLGQEFVQQSTLLFQILALSFFLNGFAYVPFTAIQGLGRPDLKAKLDLVLTPIFIGLAWGFISKMGINGAALAKFVITVIDVICLFWLSQKLMGFSMRALLSETLGRGLLVSLFFVSVTFALTMASKSFGCDIFSLILCTSIYVIAFWKIGLDEKDRTALYGIQKRLFG